MFSSASFTIPFLVTIAAVTLASPLSCSHDLVIRGPRTLAGAEVGVCAFVDVAASASLSDALIIGPVRARADAGVCACIEVGVLGIPLIVKHSDPSCSSHSHQVCQAGGPKCVCDSDYRRDPKTGRCVATPPPPPRCPSHSTKKCDRDGKNCSCVCVSGYHKTLDGSKCISNTPVIPVGTCKAVDATVAASALIHLGTNVEACLCAHLSSGLVQYTLPSQCMANAVITCSATGTAHSCKCRPGFILNDSKSACVSSASGGGAGVGVGVGVGVDAGVGVGGGSHGSGAAGSNVVGGASTSARTAAKSTVGTAVGAGVGTHVRASVYRH